jgi:spore coat protein U-like protein
MKSLTRVLAVAAFCMVTAGAAQAQTATANFTVSANVQAACLVAATDLAFGNYLATATTPTDSTSTVTVTCTAGTGYSVGIVGGATGRSMTGPGAATLNYGMYNEAARSTAFSIPTATGTGAGQAYTVYGRVPALQYAAAGNYTETVTVQVAY